MKHRNFFCTGFDEIYSIVDRDPFPQNFEFVSMRVCEECIEKMNTHMCSFFWRTYGFQDACRDANQVTGKWLHLSAPYIIERGYAHVHMMSTRRGHQEAYKVRELA